MKRLTDFATALNAPDSALRSKGHVSLDSASKERRTLWTIERERATLFGDPPPTPDLHSEELQDFNMPTRHNRARDPTAQAGLTLPPPPSPNPKEFIAEGRALNDRQQQLGAARSRVQRMVDNKAWLPTVRKLRASATYNLPVLLETLELVVADTNYGMLVRVNLLLFDSPHPFPPFRLSRRILMHALLPEGGRP
jgi:hypothetical protein